MEISVETLTKILEEGNYNIKNCTTNLADMDKNENGSFSIFQPLVEFMVTAIQNNQLAQANSFFRGDDIMVRLENNVINLPYQNIDSIKKIMSSKSTMFVNVYSIIESPDVNVSSLRIDKVASADYFVSHIDEMKVRVANWMDNILLTINNHKNILK